MVVGDIQKCLWNRSLVLEWTIPAFFPPHERITEVYRSPVFEGFKNSWHLELSTNERNAVGNFSHICLVRYCNLHPQSLWYTFGVKTVEGTEERKLFWDYLDENTQTNGAGYFIPMSGLLRRESQLSVSDALIIICTLNVEPPVITTDPTCFSAEKQKGTLIDGGAKGENLAHLRAKDRRFVSSETQTEDLRDEGAREDDCGHLCRRGRRFVSSETQTENLTDDEGAREDDSRYLGTRGGIIQQKHIKDMLLEGQDHDVTLKVKDKEFRAHKNILRARSPVFTAMFTHNMKEAECGDVIIEDCDPTAFGEFLEYVYTGNVDNLTPKNALGLYYAGDKYDFPDLKEVCVEFLKTSLSPNVVCDVIDMAMKHSEKDLLDCSMVFFMDHVMEIWETVEWQRFLKCNSTLANEINIKAMKSCNKNM